MADYCIELLKSELNKEAKKVEIERECVRRGNQLPRQLPTLPCQWALF